MPPAFNLSQDQTLQFNLLFSLFTSGRSLSESDLNFRSNLTSVRALHYLLASGSKSAASSIKRPHLSAVCLLKNFAINFVHRVAALSAAEKRDYAELFRRCQQLVEEFLSINSLPTTTRSTANHLPPDRPQTRSTPASPPLNITTATCVSALCFAARANYRRVSRTAQALSFHRVFSALLTG